MAGDVITTYTVMAALRSGDRTIWDLAAAFRVPAADAHLHHVLDGLLTAGAVQASDPNLYTATLEVIR